MTEREIAVQVVDNVKVGGDKFNALKKAAKEYVAWAAQKNKEVFTEMVDESKFLAVCGELADIALPDTEVKDELNKKAPFWLKPFIGVIVVTFKKPLFALILNGVDQKILDKKLSPDWYNKLRELALAAK